MASITTNTETQSSNIITRAAVGVWNWLIALGEANARTREIEALLALSDDELAKMGLDRSRVVLHVYRDRVSF